MKINDQILDITRNVANLAQSDQSAPRENEITGKLQNLQLLLGL